ncbi:MAG: threonine/serine exporter family protein [Solirubrobacterales bacterium]
MEAGAEHRHISLTESDYDDLQQFLLYLGSGLSAAGEAVHNVQAHLRNIAHAYGKPEALIAVLPTLAIVSIEPGRPTTIEPTEQLDSMLRLDQTAALYELVDLAESAEITPAEGNEQIAKIVGSDSRFSWPWSLVGHVVLVVSICLILQPTWDDVWLAAIFGFFVGLIKLAGARWTRLTMLLPVISAFAVSGATFELAKHGWANADLRAMMAPLVTFLPGAMLTTGVVELAAAELITGASRLVAGTVQLLLLAFGIVAAAQFFGLPGQTDLISEPLNLIGWWAPWAGVMLFGIGVFLHMSAPRSAFPWLWIVMLLAWGSQSLANEAIGGYLSAIVGGLVMTLAAHWIARRPSAPPALVLFIPGFLLLVPGALGLIGVTETLSSGAIGYADLGATVGSIFAVALGVLLGSPLSTGAVPVRRRVH